MDYLREFVSSIYLSESDCDFVALQLMAEAFVEEEIDE